MSVKIMSRVWDQSKHDGSALLLLLALADHASDDGVCWPGIPRLALKIRKTERHLKRLITHLEESGELYLCRGRGRGNANLYFIVLGLKKAEIEHTLIKRFDLNNAQASLVANEIIQRKGDIGVTVSGKKGDVNVQEKVTPVSEKVTPVSEKGDIAMSPEPSLTVNEPSMNRQLDSGQKGQSPYFQAGDDQLMIAAKCQQMREQAGGNFADPSTDNLASFGLLCLYSKREKTPPKQGTREHTQQCERVRQALRTYNYQQAPPELVEKAAEIHCERKGEWTNVFYKSFVMDFGQALSDAEYFLKHGYLPDNRKGATHGPHRKRAARDDPGYRVATDEEAAPILAQIEADRAA